VILNQGTDFLKTSPGKMAASALNSIGYNSQLLGSDVTVSYRNGEIRNVTLGGIAYTEEDTMLEHASIVVHPIQNHSYGMNAVGTLEVLSAPFFLLYSNNEETFRLWAAAAEPGGKRKVWDALDIEISPSALHETLPRYADDMAPKKVADVKAGHSRFSSPAFANLTALQLQFFADLATRETLVEHFAHALNKLRQGFDAERAAQLAVQLLAWRVLVDRKGFTSWTSPGVIPDNAKRHNIEGYFDWTKSERDSQSFASAAELIARLNYSGFNVDFLRYIYHEAFDRAVAKQLGRFDTPLWLTRALVDRIPFELLPPKDRNLVDLTCGWGSFLVAAQNRFRAMPDMHSGQELTSQIRGNELEPLTAGLARFAMLLTSGHNTWEINTGNALDWTPPTTWEVFSIVGNPPYGTSDTDPSRTEHAYKFLDYAFQKLPIGGFLSLVLPATFMSAQKGNEYRQRLLEEFELFELWQLPTGIFAKASGRTVAFIAQRKNAPNNHPARIGFSIPTPKSINLLQSNIFTSATIELPDRWKSINTKARGRLTSTSVISPSLILPFLSWQRLGKRTLNDISDICYGLIRGNPDNNKNRFAGIPPEIRPFLQKNCAAIKPFCVSLRGQEIINYPHDLEEPGFTGKADLPSKKEQLQRPKVVTPTTLTEDWGQMIAGGIDRSGTFFSNNFYCISVGPESIAKGITVEYIAAIINWWVASAWVGEHRQMLYLRSETLRAMPVPASPSIQLINQITECVRQIESGVVSTESLDELMLAAYEIDPNGEDFHRLRAVFYWKRDVQPNEDVPSLRPLSVAGKVISIDLSGKSMDLWTDINDFITLPLDTNLPGWMLRPGAIFGGRAEVDSGGKIHRLTTVTPDPYSYLTADEVSARLVQAITNKG
jgi:hypothetical protein